MLRHVNDPYKCRCSATSKFRLVICVVSELRFVRGGATHIALHYSVDVGEYRWIHNVEHDDKHDGRIMTTDTKIMFVNPRVEIHKNQITIRYGHIRMSLQ